MTYDRGRWDMAEECEDIVQKAHAGIALLRQKIKIQEENKVTYEQGFKDGLEKAKEIIRSNELWGQSSKMLGEIDALDKSRDTQSTLKPHYTFDESEGWKDEQGCPA